jgi:outer membrane protein OmpA-like peptidoglycan-associated protein
LQRFSGESSFGTHPELLAEIRLGRVRVTMNAGMLTRENTSLGAVTISDEATWGVGLGIPLIEDGSRLDLLVESYGSLALENLGEREGTPIEAIAGLKYHLPIGLYAGVAGGAGIAAGIGTPLVRVVGTVGYAAPPSAAADTDGDGIDDDHDRDGADDAPIEPEVDDEDGDGIPRPADRCPREPEDVDGIEDHDGCPEDDADGDGVADGDDRGPTEPGRPRAGECHGCPETCGQEEDVDVPEPLAADVTISFSPDSSRLSDADIDALEGVRDAMQANSAARVRLVGHADSSGSAALNMRLSVRRALAVRRWLTQNGVGGGRVDAWACGDSMPRAGNDSAEERRRNRRVQLTTDAAEELGDGCRRAR